MDKDGNTAPGDCNTGILSRAECELLLSLARDVAAGQVIVALHGGEDDAAISLAGGAPEIAGDRLHSLNTGDEDYGPTSRTWKLKVGLLWYNASGEYEDLLTALSSWQRHLSPEAKIGIRGCDRQGIARVIKEYVGSCGDLILIDSVGTVAVLAADTCVHHWIIDVNDFGICKYCGRKRDFRRLRNQSSGMEAKRRVFNRKRK